MPDKPTHICSAEGCDRAFLTEKLLADHAEAVHTYDERRSLVRTAVQEFIKSKLPIGRSIWVYVRDMTDDWVVFEVGESDDLLRVSYTLDENGNVAIAGEPVKVRSRVVYEVVVTEAGA